MTTRETAFADFDLFDDVFSFFDNFLDLLDIFVLHELRVTTLVLYRFFEFILHTRR